MMKIIFNHDGSIKEITLPESIQQGNDGVDEIYLEWEGYPNTDYVCDAIFVLPNESANQLVATMDGVGYKITLTAAQTIYAGRLFASFRLKDLNNTLFSYQYTFWVNPTDAYIDQTAISLAQYNSIVQALNSYVLKGDLDEEYQAKDETLTSISELPKNETGLVKITNGVASLDNDSYYTVEEVDLLLDGKVPKTWVNVDSEDINDLFR